MARDDDLSSEKLLKVQYLDQLTVEQNKPLYSDQIEAPEKTKTDIN